MFLELCLRLLGFLYRLVDYLIRNLCFYPGICNKKILRRFGRNYKTLLVLELECWNRVYSRFKHIMRQLHDHVSCNFCKGKFYSQIPSSSTWTLDSDNYKRLKHYSSKSLLNLWTQFLYLHRSLQIFIFFQVLSLDPNVGYNCN